CELIQASVAKRIDPGIFPDIGAIAPVLPKLERIGVRLIALLEHKAKLVLGAIEAAHARIVFGPDHKVLEREVIITARGGELGQVSPVHEDKQNGSILGGRLGAAQKPVNSLSDISPDAIANSWC